MNKVQKAQHPYRCQDHQPAACAVTIASYCPAHWKRMACTWRVVSSEATIVEQEQDSTMATRISEFVQSHSHLISNDQFYTFAYTHHVDWQPRNATVLLCKSTACHCYVRLTCIDGAVFTCHVLQTPTRFTFSGRCCCLNAGENDPCDMKEIYAQMNSEAAVRQHLLVLQLCEHITMLIPELCWMIAEYEADTVLTLPL
jgi:hypothetical protein